MMILSALPTPTPPGADYVHDCAIDYSNFWQTLLLRITRNIRGFGWESLYGTDLKTELIVASLITALFAVLILRRKWFRRPLAIVLIIAVYVFMVFAVSVITSPIFCI